MGQGSPLDLGKRERQIVEAVYRLGEAAVADVLPELDDPPSYSSVRAMLGMLVEKGVCSVQEFADEVRRVDAEDGRVDGLSPID